MRNRATARQVRRYLDGRAARLVRHARVALGAAVPLSAMLVTSRAASGQMYTFQWGAAGIVAALVVTAVACLYLAAELEEKAETRLAATRRSRISYQAPRPARSAMAQTGTPAPRPARVASAGQPAPVLAQPVPAVSRPAIALPVGSVQQPVELTTT